MTSKVEAVKAIEKRLNSLYSMTEIAFDNETPVERENEFISISVQLGPSHPSLDNGYERTTGVAMIRALVPKGKGDILAWTLAETAAATLEYASFDGVSCTSGDYTNAGDLSGPDGAWYQVNVTIPFFFARYTGV